jgi:hypothetical protein
MILTLIGNGAFRVTGVECGEIEEIELDLGFEPKAFPTNATERITSMVCYVSR